MTWADWKEVGSIMLCLVMAIVAGFVTIGIISLMVKAVGGLY